MIVEGRIFIIIKDKFFMSLLIGICIKIFKILYVCFKLYRIGVKKILIFLMGVKF